MKELKVNELSLVFGGSPLKVIGGIATYIVGREVIDPMYDQVRDNIVNTPIHFPVSVPIGPVSPSWTSGKTGNIRSTSQYMPGSSYPTKIGNQNKSGSDYDCGDGTDYQG